MIPILKMRNLRTVKGVEDCCNFSLISKLLKTLSVVFLACSSLPGGVILCQKTVMSFLEIRTFSNTVQENKLKMS